MKKIIASIDDALSGPILGKGVKFLFSFALTGVAVIGVHPNLAESFTWLIGAEQIEAALEQRHEREEILWFARAVYSESQFTKEQHYIAWAIRNRVESKYYPETYEGVVLQPKQFSGLNSYDKRYEINISRDYGVGDEVWESALAVATEIYHADGSERLLPVNAMHFYSPVVIAPPEWTWGHAPVAQLYGKHGVRFAFYAGVK